MSVHQVDPAGMTKHEWDMLWCRFQGSKHEAEIAAYKQATPDEAMSGARGLITQSMTLELDEPIHTAINYVVILRSALNDDIQGAEKEAMQEMLSQVEDILRANQRNKSKAAKMLFALSK